MPRSRLGPLAIESKLGDDPSQSSVWRAVHVQLKRAVAVKIFAAPFGGTLAAREAFATEWELLKKIQHPAIVKCYGGGFEETDAYLAHELIEGETLAAQIRRSSRLPWESVLDLAEPLASAVEYLHHNKITHGAIRPDNVMIAGLSPILLGVRIDRTETPYKTSQPITAAQLAVQSPEMVADSTPTPSSDLYSLGAVLYWAITGDPPISGKSVEEIRGNVTFQTPISPSSVVLDCPIWLSKLVLQLLEKDPAKRPPNATAVKSALAEVRKRAMSRTSVAEHESAGFSALRMTDQKDRDEARTLLGRDLIDLDNEEKAPDATLWHDKSWVLITAMLVIFAGLAWIAWPASEDALRQKAEALILQDTRSALSEAKTHPLRQLLRRFPDGKHASWAKAEIDRINVVLFFHQLNVKIKNNFPINDQGEKLHKRALEFEDIGDISKALDMYRSMVTVLGDDEKYTTAVNAAQSKIAALETSSEKDVEATRIVRSKLDEADRLLKKDRIVEARNIWYSLIDLYGNNSELAPLISEAQERLQENKQSVKTLRTRLQESSERQETGQ